MIRGIIFDFKWTIYDPRKNGLSEGAIELLERLKGSYKLCLVTCCISRISVEGRKQQISALGLDRYFGYVVVLPHDKTANDFKECLENMHLKPEEIIVVGDRITSEIYYGNNLGMITVRYKSGKYADLQPENDLQKADYEITHLSQLSDLLSARD